MVVTTSMSCELSPPPNAAEPFAATTPSAYSHRSQDIQYEQARLFMQQFHSQPPSAYSHPSSSWMHRCATHASLAQLQEVSAHNFHERHKDSPVVCRLEKLTLSNEGLEHYHDRSAYHHSAKSPRRTLPPLPGRN